MLALLAQLPAWTPYALWGAHAVLEYWLGRTDAIEAGSVLEAILKTANSILPAGKKPD